jgi:hypothetical protein
MARRTVILEVEVDYDSRYTDDESLVAVADLLCTSKRASAERVRS